MKLAFKSEPRFGNEPSLNKRSCLKASKVLGVLCCTPSRLGLDPQIDLSGFP